MTTPDSFGNDIQASLGGNAVDVGYFAGERDQAFERLCKNAEDLSGLYDTAQNMPRDVTKVMFAAGAFTEIMGVETSDLTPRQPSDVIRAFADTEHKGQKNQRLLTLDGLNFVDNIISRKDPREGYKFIAKQVASGESETRSHTDERDLNNKEELVLAMLEQIEVLAKYYALPSTAAHRGMHEIAIAVANQAGYENRYPAKRYGSTPLKRVLKPSDMKVAWEQFNQGKIRKPLGNLAVSGASFTADNI